MKNNPHESILLGQFIGKYLTNTESAKEKEAVDKWMNERSEHKELLNSINSNKKLIQEYELMDSFNEKMALERFKEKLLLKSKIKALVRWRVAASIFVLVGVIGILYFLSNNYSKTNVKSNLYTSVFTENGQRSVVVLPDSSIVWLNSGTTLSYLGDFSNQNRKVVLNGQAFFQVSHKRDHPFLVEANGFVVTVMGTKFDVSAYSEVNEIAVVLESGKVKLTHQDSDSFSYTMKPGEKAIASLADNREIEISRVDAGVYSSWKEGKLIFRNSPMKDVIEKLRKWYNVNIEITDPEVYNSIFSGTVKNESYEEIFRLIGIACKVDCEIVHNYNKEAKPQIIISKR
ncbi:FecR family protein [Maribellus maritimus]|uniref:FecR family protein n=1 Tax=Maribellus maritimus TaxID=2870838 RepID=UPI001EEA7F83|nr:FecR family protein [Maribellus maritimus]MCG6190031.1 FecR domain-containing protein [Maribellus maritimus]